MRDSLLLLSNFIKNPREVGAVAPSSKFLTKEIIKRIEFAASKTIVELGPGLGTFTKPILKKAKSETMFFCFEVNKKFCRYLTRSIIDERLVVINAGAENLKSYLKKNSIGKADCIISGLPFLNFSDSKRKKILEAVRSCLSSRGRFILFQYTNGLGRLLNSYFDKVNRKFVPLNMPPCFVYICEK